MKLKPIFLNIYEKLQDPEYFKEFAHVLSQDEVALAIRNLREKRGMNQAALAAASEMQQSSISRMENPDYSGWTFNSLRRLAEAMNAKVCITFKTQEELIEEYKNKEQQGEVNA